jgi:hypothetical protein
VEVVDVPAATVVSLGARGYMTEDQVALARKRLERWLEGQIGQVADGPVRVMGYNSPFVPASRRFWEVQIPARKGRQVRDGLTWAWHSCLPARGTA